MRVANVTINELRAEKHGRIKTGHFLFLHNTVSNHFLMIFPLEKLDLYTIKAQLKDTSR